MLLYLLPDERIDLKRNHTYHQDGRASIDPSSLEKIFIDKQFKVAYRVM